MSIKNKVTTALFALSVAMAPSLVQGLDLSFLGQAPLRFFNEEDLRLMGEATDQALDGADDGEEIAWSNEQTGSSGTITPIRSFTRQDNDCRRVEIVNRAKQATRGAASTRVDFCNAEGTWKVLSIVQ